MTDSLVVVRDGLFAVAKGLTAPVLNLQASVLPVHLPTSLETQWLDFAYRLAILWGVVWLFFRAKAFWTSMGGFSGFRERMSTMGMDTGTGSSLLQAQRTDAIGDTTYILGTGMSQNCIRQMAAARERASRASGAQVLPDASSTSGFSARRTGTSGLTSTPMGSVRLSESQLMNLSQGGHA